MHVLTRMAAHCELQLKLRIRDYLQQKFYNTQLKNIFHINTIIIFLFFFPCLSLIINIIIIYNLFVSATLNKQDFIL